VRERRSTLILCRGARVRLCDWFRTPAYHERCHAHRGRRAKAARERRRGIGATGSAGSMGNWLALTVQELACAGGVDAANEWRRCDGRPKQRRERRI
jgi:hypothetical protein